MKYIIDSANRDEINQCLHMGIRGVTANPSMYKKNNEDFYDFITYYTQKDLDFLSGEVMEENVHDMLLEVDKLLKINPKIVIKINFSPEGLKLATILNKRGIKTAFTLIFTINQALAALQTGCDYLFPFIGRNDGIGMDGLDFVCSLQNIINEKHYNTKIVAASIKNLHQLTQIAKMGIDCAAVPYKLYMQSLSHPLTDEGFIQFKNDWSSNL